MKQVIRRLLLLGSVLSFSMASVAFAAEYTVDKDHTTIEFQVNHLLGKQRGQFDDFDGKFAFDPAKVSKSKVTFTIQAASINTNNKKRDEHLRSPDFFNVAQYKTLSFEGHPLVPAGDKKYKLTGNLTMHGVTKEVTFDVDYLGNIKDPWGMNRAAFVAKTKVNRKDFGLTWNKVLETGGLMVGEDVEITMNIEAVEKTAKKM